MQRYGHHTELGQNPPSRYVDGMVMRSECFFEIIFTKRSRTKMVFECLGSDGTFEADTVYEGGKGQGWVNCAVGGTFKRERDLHYDPLNDLSALSSRLGFKHSPSALEFVSRTILVRSEFQNIYVECEGCKTSCPQHMPIREIEHTLKVRR